MGTARVEGTRFRGRSQARAPPSVLSRAAPSSPRTRWEGALSLRARSCRGIAGRGQGVEKGEAADRPGGSDSRGRGSANLRALTRGAAPRRSDIWPPGRGHREAPPWALRSGRRCTCRGSPAARCDPRPLRLPIGPRGPAPSLPSGSPPPGRSERAQPCPKEPPILHRPARRRSPDRIAPSRHRHPQAARPGRNGAPHGPPARLMSAAGPEPVTRLGPSSADEDPWARSPRARPLRRGERDRPEMARPARAWAVGASHVARACEHPRSW